AADAGSRRDYGWAHRPRRLTGGGLRKDARCGDRSGVHHRRCGTRPGVPRTLDVDGYWHPPGRARLADPIDYTCADAVSGLRPDPPRIALSGHGNPARGPADSLVASAST